LHTRDDNFVSRTNFTANKLNFVLNKETLHVLSLPPSPGKDIPPKEVPFIRSDKLDVNYIPE
jgi:hypothetical protein